MDNITHTLVGAALAEAGLKKRTALASATLIIGANFPDVDVLALAFPDSIDVRRGATHGFLAMAILPFVLAWLLSLYDRHVRRRRDPGAPPADVRQLTILAAAAIWTHPTLDFMNIYGMRWLMPFVNKWFYADALFIVDLYLLVILGAAVWWSRRTKQTRPARVALGALAGYTLVMLGITAAGRARVEEQYRGMRSMVAPVALVPWHREVVVDLGDRYRFGSWYPARGLEIRADIPKGDNGPERDVIKRARAHRDARAFLRWSRFPYYQVTREDGATVVRMQDARYPGATWASAVVRLP